MNEAAQVPERRANDTPAGDTARILAILYTLGFIGMVGALLIVNVPPDNKDIVISLVSIMATVQVGIVNFYFGSSKNAEVSQKAAIVAKDKADSSLQVIAKAAAPTASQGADQATGAASITTTTKTEVAPTGKGKKKP